MAFLCFRSSLHVCTSLSYYGSDVRSVLPQNPRQGVILGTMTSADPSRFSPSSLTGLSINDVPVRSPQVSVRTFTPCNRRIYTDASVQCGTSAFIAVSSAHPCLVCGFCSSVRGFALDFLQIPPHGGHPCLRLTVPTVKPVEDFHLQVRTHVGRTTNQRAPPANYLLFPLT